ncbi:MAG: SMC-Scp complex subunit ScpB, partial [Thermoleophilia bacterium]
MENRDEEDLNLEPLDNIEETYQPDDDMPDDSIPGGAFPDATSSDDAISGDEASEDPTETSASETRETDIEDPARRVPERDVRDIARDIEAVLFISSEPVTLEVLAEVTAAEGEGLAHAVEAVREKYSDDDGGIMFAQLAGGYTFRTG